MDFIFDPSLVLYLPLYELDGVSFMSKDAYGHLCTVTGALWRPDGRYFDGSDDYIDCGAPSPFIGGLNEATILGWFNPSDADEASQVLIGRFETPGTKRWCFRYSSARTLSFYPNPTDGWIYSDSGIVTLNIFQHLTVVKTATEVRFYKDGEGAGSGASTTALELPTADLYIGRFTHAGGQYQFPGVIGEILVYNRALTPLEIQHNYLATKWRYR